MTSHLDDTELLNAAFGPQAQLSDERRMHARTCALCQRSVQLATEFVASAIETSLCVDALTPTPTGPAIRLLASLDRLETYTPYAGLLGDVLGVSEAEARRYLHTFEDESLWKASWISGSFHRFVELDLPAFKEGHAMAFRLGPGATIPEHRHHGEERCLLLEGRLLVDGALHRVGDVIIAADESTHTMTVPEDDMCLCVIANVGPIELLEQARTVASRDASHASGTS